MNALGVVATVLIMMVGYGCFYMAGYYHGKRKANERCNETLEDVERRLHGGRYA